MHSNIKIKKAIIIALALMGSSYSLHSDAVTMGDIVVKSALGQPLLAQVKISGADAKVDESCFTVASDDPDNGVMLKYNPSNALITIQSQHPVVEPATSLTVFNRCQTPSKRNYTFIVDAQDLSASADTAKTESPKKALDDKFHYQRTFNKLTKQTEQEHKAKTSPDRLIYEDHGNETRAPSKLAPVATMSAPIANDNEDDALSLKDLASQMGILGDKTSKPNKTITKAPAKDALAVKETVKEPLTKVAPETSTIKTETGKTDKTTLANEEQKTAANKDAVAKDNVAKELATKDSISKDTKEKELESKAKEPASKQTNAKEQLSISKNEGVGHGNSKDGANNPQLSDELTSMENRMGELQQQVTALYNINSTLEKLFKQISQQLTQVKKENDFLRSLALCLGAALLISGYFFADWLRRKKHQPAFDREPPMWASPNLSSAPNASAANAPDSQFAFSSNLASNGMAPVKSNNVFGDTGFAPVATSNASVLDAVATDEKDPFDSIPSFKASATDTLNTNKATVNNPLADAQPLTKQEPASGMNWFDLGEPLSPLPEQALPKQVAPSNPAPNPAIVPAMGNMMHAESGPQINQFTAPQAQTQPTPVQPVQPVVQQPVAQQPVFQQAVTPQPAIQQPIVQEIIAQQPAIQQAQVQMQPQAQPVYAPAQHTVTPVISTAPSMPAPVAAPQPALTITRIATPTVNVTRQTAEPVARPAVTPSATATSPTPAPSNKVSHVASPQKKGVIKVQPAGVMDDVDVFLTHGRTNLAIQLLQNHLMEHPKESAVVWIFLLDLLAKEGKRREYEITANECRKHFNIKLSDFSMPVAQNDSIESFERISAALQKVWGTPLVLSFIDELIYNSRLVPRMGFDRAIFDELIFLREVAEEELRMDQAQPQVSTVATSNVQVSDEFRQLAADLKAENQRKQDVNQYLSQFEFNLDELNKS